MLIARDEVESAETAPLVPKRRPESEPTERVPVAVIFAAVRLPEK